MVINQVSNFSQRLEKSSHATGTTVCMKLIDALQKCSIKAAFTFPISGMMCPPMLIYPYKMIPSEITNKVPHDRSMTIREETVGSEFITELKIREGKMRQNLCSRGRLVH
jgi:hypothetical protein